MSLENDQKSIITVITNPSSGQTSEIHLDAATQNLLPFLQKIQANNEENKRREALTRRPSYRKIFNDLSSGNTTSGLATVVSSGNAIPSAVTLSIVEAANKAGQVVQSVPRGSLPANSVLLQSASGSAVGSPALVTASGQTLQLSSGNILQSGQTIQLSQGNQGLQAALALGGAQQPTILQYTQTADGNTVLIPVSLGATQYSPQQSSQQFVLSGAGPTVTHSSNVSNGPLGMSVLPSPSPPSPVHEDSSKKREMRLLKNREAARECRRKKKEYVKCLENRVAILESQNQKLIEELQKLHSFYSKDATQQVPATQTVVVSSPPPTLSIPNTSTIVTCSDGTLIQLPSAAFSLAGVSSAPSISSTLTLIPASGTQDTVATIMADNV